MWLRTRFASLCNLVASLCNLVFPCFSFAEELSDEDVVQESPGCAREELLPESVICEILSKLPVESISAYRVVCKSWYVLVNGLSEKSDGDHHLTGSADSSCCISELPDSVIREILSKLPIENIKTYRVVSKSWYVLVDELFNKSVGDHNLNDSSYVSELPGILIRNILLNLPIESIRGVCKAWNQCGKELSSRSYSSSLSELHNSVIHEILAKLPVKSIEQCRYVCKSWYMLISDPYFARVYFKNPTLTSIAFSKHKSPTRCLEDESFGFIEIGRNGNVSRKPMNVTPLISPAKKSWKTLIGSCDGLLCFVEIPYEDCYQVYPRVTNSLYGPNQVVWIVNPLIGEYAELPRNHVFNYDRAVYGFGSTVDGDQYKVVRFARNDSRCEVVAQILTIGVDEKWRDLDIFTFPLLLYSHGVILNGVLHWVGFGRHGSTYGHVVYAFDIAKETGQYFTFPFEHDPYYSFLVEWNGHLCIIGSKPEVQVDLWTMKRYGVCESWTRDTVLTNNNSSAHFYLLVPVTTTRNGDLLLWREFDKSLMSFDLRTKKCIELEIFEGNGTCFSMFAYTRSFVSLRGMIFRHNLSSVRDS